LNKRYIIGQYLKLKPVYMDDCFWGGLQRYGLCRSATEERKHRILKAAHVEPNLSNSFAAHISKGLECALYMDNATRSTKFSFIEDPKQGVDAFYDDDAEVHDFLTSDKFLNYHKAHGGALCYTGNRTNGLFVCDHIIMHLWEEMMKALVEDDPFSTIAKTRGLYRGKLGQKLQAMPRAVKIWRTAKSGKMIVSWTSVQSKLYPQTKVKVTLHAKTCSSASSEDDAWSTRSFYRTVGILLI
jgi:hypothetical protein